MPAFIMGELPIFQQPAVVDLFADSFYEHPKKRHQRQLLAASRHTAQQLQMERESKQQQQQQEGEGERSPPTSPSASQQRQLSPPPTVEDVPIDKEFLEHKARQEAALAAQAAMAKQAGKGETVNIVLPKEPNTLTPALSLIHKAIAKTLGEQYDAVSSVFDNAEVGRVKRMETLMSESLDHVTIFPAGQQSEAELDRFMFAFMRRIRALNIADALIIPIGFAASTVGQARPHVPAGGGPQGPGALPHGRGQQHGGRRAGVPRHQCQLLSCHQVQDGVHRRRHPRSAIDGQLVLVRSVPVPMLAAQP